MKRETAILFLVLVSSFAAGCSSANSWVTKMRQENIRETGVEDNVEHLKQLEEKYGKPPGFRPVYTSNEDFMQGYQAGYYSGYGEGKAEGLNGEPFGPSLKEAKGVGMYEAGYTWGFGDGYYTGFADGTFAADIGADLSEGGYEDPEGGSGSRDFEISSDYETGYRAGRAKGFSVGKMDKKAGYGYNSMPSYYDIIGNEEYQRGFHDGYQQGYEEGYNDD